MSFRKCIIIEQVAKIFRSIVLKNFYTTATNVNVFYDVSIGQHNVVDNCDVKLYIFTIL